MPHSASQDADVRFAVFLNPIRDLTKNWEVDIAKVSLIISVNKK